MLNISVLKSNSYPGKVATAPQWPGCPSIIMHGNGLVHVYLHSFFILLGTARSSHSQYLYVIKVKKKKKVKYYGLYSVIFKFSDCSHSL